MLGKRLEQAGENLLLRFHRAELIPQSQAPGLYGMVQELARRAGTQTPALYRVMDPAINAFAVAMGRSRGCVALTTGLIQRLDREELAAVLAHHFAQLRSGHTLRMTIAGVIGLRLRTMGVARPVAALLPTVLRTRRLETRADEESVKLLGDPMPLIRVLEKIRIMERTEANSFDAPLQTADPATAFLFFLNPTLSSLDALFALRLRRLREFSLRRCLIQR